MNNIRMACPNDTSALPCWQGMYDESPSVDSFCHKYVEVMGEESDHVHIVALSDALQVRGGSRSRSVRL